MPAITITVSTAAQLTKAIAGLKGGETILLNPGDYGAVAIKGKALSSTVTFKSADPNHDAVLTDLRIDRSNNIRIEDIDIHHVLGKTEANTTPGIYVSKGSNIELIGLDISGSMDGNSWNDGIGLRVDSTNGLRLLDSTFTQLKVAAAIYSSTDAVVAGNSVTDVREGFDFAGMDTVTIAQNRFWGFTPNYAAGDHSDSIQFWNGGVNAGSNNVTIVDNVILQGANGGTQGIFVRAELPAYRHSNFTIENNLYYGDSRHGITLGGVDGATVKGNTLVYAPGGVLEPGININGDTKVIVTGNITPLLLSTATTGATFSGNVDLWDGSQKLGLALKDVFADATGPIDIASFMVKPGSSTAALGAGFHAIAGIGAASFDAAHLAAGSHLMGLLPLH